MGSPSCQHARRASAGFSLVELMVVIAILGIAAGATRVAWESMVPRARLNSAVRALASAMWEGRSDAIARNAELFLVYDLDEERYWVLGPYRDGGGFARTMEERQIVVEGDLQPDIAIEHVAINETVYENGQVQIAFHPNGTATGHTVLLNQKLFDRFFTVELLSLTGLIRFHDGEFEREYPRESDFE